MDRQPFLQDFQQRLLDMLRASPAADVERNLKALVNQTFNKLELVTREDFDIQRDLLRELSARVEALEVSGLRARTAEAGGAAASGRSPRPAAGSAQGPAATERPAPPDDGNDGFYPGPRG